MRLASTRDFIIRIVPVYDFAIEHEEMANVAMDGYNLCCEKSICSGCIPSVSPFAIPTESPKLMKVNNLTSIFLLAGYYLHGVNGFQQDRTKAIELYARAGQLGHSKAHNNLTGLYHAGQEVTRFILGCLEAQSGNMKRAITHWKIAASTGEYDAIHELRIS